MRSRLPALLLSLATLLTAHHPAEAAQANLQTALASITTNDVLRHTRVLASDEFEGRAPGSRGEELAVRYVAEAFQRSGLEPAGTDGSWFQQVPLVGIRSTVKLHASRNSTTGTAATEEWITPQDFVGWSPRMTPRVSLAASELVFVGYGVVAPEFGWDDFKDVDVRGKTLVMLVNDPPVPDPKDPSKLDDAMFRGRAMTYYGRWTYKYEIAAAKGAAAALIIHETGPAGYPYFVVVNSWGRENFDLRSPDLNAGRLAFSGWLSLDRATRLLASAGQELTALKSRALSRDFRPVALGTSIHVEVTNSLREIQSRNVAGKLTGSHPERRDEYVVFTSHWDHLGRDDRLDGDKIFNGAHDNAIGTATLIELAEAFASLPRRPDRTLLFLSVTAEEQGLLGAKYYAEHPSFPLHRTLANLNIDGGNVVGRRRDIGVVGSGQNTLEDLLVTAAASQGRTVRNEEEPEKGGYYRSDHFEFAKVGVPALYTDKWSEVIEGTDSGYGKKRRDEYRDLHYHKVSDDVKPWWDLGGAVDDTRLYFLVGYDVAQTSHWPEWKPGSEFKARREESLRKAGRP